MYSNEFDAEYNNRLENSKGELIGFVNTDNQNNYIFMANKNELAKLKLIKYTFVYEDDGYRIIKMEQISQET